MMEQVLDFTYVRTWSSFRGGKIWAKNNPRARGLSLVFISRSLMEVQIFIFDLEVKQFIASKR